MRGNVLLFVILLSVPVFVNGQEKLTLDKCRKLAMENNRKIRMAQQNQMAVNSLKKSAKTQFYPNIQFNGGYLRTNKDISLFSQDMFLPIVPHEVYENGLSVLRTNPELMQQTLVTQNLNGNLVPVEDPKTGEPMFQQYGYLPKDEAVIDMHNVFFGKVGLTQPIYMGGKIRETYNMARYGEQMFQAKAEVSQAEVIVETDERYWQVISLKEKVKLAEDYLKRIDTLLRDVQNLNDEGIITHNKVMQVQVKKNQVELEFMKAQNGLKLAQMALNQNIGLPLDTSLVLSDSLGTVEQLKNPGSYLGEALQKRPEIHALDNGVKLAESGVQFMKSRYLPNIGLTANYMMMNPNPYNGFEAEFGGDWNVGVMINIPIYHWGDRKHTLNAVRHEKRASIEKLEETRELISLEVKKTIFNYNESVKKVEMTKTNLEQAEKNLEITRDNFQEGMSKLADVLEAQSMWQEAYADYIEAKTEHKLMETRLLKASGNLSAAINE
jgi:outer membrane protein TolC